MKRFVMAAIISATMFAAAAALLASCTWMPVLEEEGDATLTFRFLQTKAGPVPDTGSFILRVCPAGADQPVYEGRYGERPATMKVPAGTYEVSAFSRSFSTPDFGDPLYGDEQLVVARSGETLSVAFRCTQRNSGLQLAFTDRFKTRYPGRLLLKQTEGQLEYGYAEQRTAWLFPGETRICYLDGKAENLLLKRSLEPGEIRSITLDATDNGSSSTFSLTVDTTAIRHAEQVVVGQEGGDGLTMATAYSVAELAATECAGDTVWVWGYVVGTILAEGTVDFDCGAETASTNLAIAASPDVREASACAGLYLSKTAHKNALNLADPANRAAVLHHKVYAQGKAYTYKKFPALTNLCEYRLE